MSHRFIAYRRRQHELFHHYPKAPEFDLLRHRHFSNFSSYKLDRNNHRVLELLRVLLIYKLLMYRVFAYRILLEESSYHHYDLIYPFSVYKLVSVDLTHF